MIAEAEAFEGKYEILEKIREGGMGAVYKVRHRLLDEIRVIKVIRPQLSTSPEMGERFLREARLAIRLRHNNIAQLHDFSIDAGGTAYIVMEFIDGLTLADVSARTAPLPLGLALEVARGALSAIGYLHRKGMIHRDVSPDNLMLGRDEDGHPRVILIDLGIAKSLVASSTLTASGVFIGKPRYASPEHFGSEGLDAVGLRSDLYSFGVVLYELLTGVCPVQGRDASSWIAGHLFRPPLGFEVSDSGGRIPPDLREILLKVLAKAPEDRFASAEEMAAALEPVRSRFPVGSGDLERALGALPAEAPLAEPLEPGTTQEALDREFAPLETPVPPPKNRGGTMRLLSRDESPAPEPLRTPARAESTQVLPSAAGDKPEPAAPAPSHTKPSWPLRRVVLALAAVFLLSLTLGILWRLRSRAPAPEAEANVEQAQATPEAVVEDPPPAPEPVKPAPEAAPPEVQATSPAAAAPPPVEPAEEPTGKAKAKVQEKETVAESTPKAPAPEIRHEPLVPAPPPPARETESLQTLYTKQGSAIQVRRYWFEKGRAYMTLPDGRTVYLEEDDVDRRRTEPGWEPPAPAPAPQPRAQAPRPRSSRPVLYTKAGSAIEIREYWIENGRAYLILPDGKTVYFDAEDVDLKRTTIPPRQPR